MRAVVFGTTGHIDHGKTALVKALTGVDCDRLPEEKRRGITIALGFAPMVDPAGEIELSFVDVPGHERLVHTMIAGTGGIDRALLVIAADEGIMPQTREHLDVLRLLAVRGGVVALNKCDLLDPGLLELRVAEVREHLVNGPLGGALIVACSATTGAGIDELRAAVLACARGVSDAPESNRPFRISIDRVFSIAGAGTVVTGTARWGEVKVGDELLALPSGRALRARGIQVHGATRPAAVAGERVALAVAGATVQELPRGEQIVSAGPWRATHRLAVAVELLDSAPELREGARLWLHLLAGRSAARVERLHPAPQRGGQHGRAVLRLARPVFAAPGDRVVLRALSPASTVGGGRVLDVLPPRLRRREAAALAALPDPAREPVAALVAWVAQAGDAGISSGELASRLGVCTEAVAPLIGRLLDDSSVVVARQDLVHLLHRDAVRTIRARAQQVLREAGALGVPLAELPTRVLVHNVANLRAFLLTDLRKAGLIRELAGRVMLSTAAPVEDELTARLEALYRQAGFAAPSPEEASRTLSLDPKVALGLVRFLIDQKRLARVGGKWVVHREVLDEVAASVQAWGVERFEVSEFKDRFGLTRKLAIPVLEWLDSQRVTRREGDLRRVVRPRTDTPKPD
jgi:selenocysteine-specific elongation factor